MSRNNLRNNPQHNSQNDNETEDNEVQPTREDLQLVHNVNRHVAYRISINIDFILYEQNLALGALGALNRQFSANAEGPQRNHFEIYATMSRIIGDLENHRNMLYTISRDLARNREDVEVRDRLGVASTEVTNYFEDAVRLFREQQQEEE